MNADDVTMPTETLRQRMIADGRLYRLGFYEGQMQSLRWAADHASDEAVSAWLRLLAHDIEEVGPPTGQQS